MGAGHIDSLRGEIRALRALSPPRQLTVSQVAEILAVSPKSVRRYVEDGKLPAAQLTGAEHGSLRVDPRDLEDFLRKRKPEPPKQKRKRVRVPDDSDL